MLAIFLGNARAFVGNRDAHPRTIVLHDPPRAHDYAPSAGVYDTALFTRLMITWHDQTRIHVGHKQLVFQLHVDAASPSAAIDVLESLPHDIRHQLGLFGQLQRAVVDTRDGQQVLHERDQQHASS